MPLRCEISTGQRSSRATVSILAQRVHHAVALLPHVNGDGQPPAAQRLKRADQPLGRVKALGRVAETEDTPPRRRRVSAPQGVQLPVLPVRQRRVVEARDEGAERPHAREHGVVHDLRRSLRCGKIVRKDAKHSSPPNAPVMGARYERTAGACSPRAARATFRSLPPTSVVRPCASSARPKFGAEQRRVGVAVDVQKAGRQRAALRVKNVRGIGVGQTTDRGNGSVP